MIRVLGIVLVILSSLFMAQGGRVLTAQSRTCATMEVWEERTINDPFLIKSRIENDKRLKRWIERGNHLKNSSVITIPIVFHIVHNGDAIGEGENISEQLILAQLDQLNHDFRRTNTDASNTPSEFLNVAADTEIQFCLASVDPDGKPTTGILRHQMNRTSWTTNQIESEVKPNTIWDRDQYLNFWSVRFNENGLLGYAQFPGGQANTDGVVCTYTALGSIAMANPDGGVFDKGRTGTHEVGHWLGLYHIWGDGDCSVDDEVDDTPNQSQDSNGCPSHPQVSCGSNDMFMNYMDYSDDDCMNVFTLGQKARMLAVLDNNRSGLMTSGGCAGNDDFAMALSNSTVGFCPSVSSVDIKVYVEFLGGFNENVSLSIQDVPSGLNVGLNPTLLSSSDSSSLTLTDNGLASGSYTVGITGIGGGRTQVVSLSITKLTSIPSEIALSSPADMFEEFSLSGKLEWQEESNATSYTIQIASEETFSSLIIDQELAQTTLDLDGILSPSTTYFWRVKGQNDCGEGPFSSHRQFLTEQVSEICETFESAAIPMDIKSNQTVSSSLPVLKNGVVNSLSVRDLNITHTWIGDLILELQGPDGTSVQLLSQICDDDQYQNMSIEFDDDGLANIPCPATSGMSYRPNESLSAFNNKNINGTWGLSVTDVFTFDEGTLDSWSIEVCYEPSNVIPSCNTDELVSGLIANDLYQSADSLMVDGTITSGGDVRFKAADYILFKPNFSISKDASMEATIEECTKD